MAKICLAVQNLNGQRWLWGCLSAVLAVIKASFNHQIEVFILDAGSTDRSIEIIKQYPFHLVQHPMLSQSAAMNMVFREQLEHADYFAGINNDDIWMPNFVNIHMDEMLEHPEVDMAHGRCIFFNEINRSTFSPATNSWEQAFIEKRNNICQPTMLFARKCFQRFGFFDETIKNPYDFEYSARVWKNGGIIRWIDSEPLAFYRCRQDSLTATGPDITNRECEEIVRRYLT